MVIHQEPSAWVWVLKLSKPSGKGWFGLFHSSFNSCGIAVVPCSQAVQAQLGSVKLELLSLAIAEPQVFHLFLLEGQGREGRNI